MCVKAFLDRPTEGDWPYVRTDFLRSLARRGLRGVKLVSSDAHRKVSKEVWRNGQKTGSGKPVKRPSAMSARKRLDPIRDLHTGQQP